MKEITYRPIGIIHTPNKKIQGTPIQGPAAKEIAGEVEIFPEYINGLKDLDGFSHIFLLYHFHLTKNPKLIVKPFLDDKMHGLFATRAPSRPNSIGISVVELIKIEKNILYVKNVDIIDKTPLLDIKPFIADFNLKNKEVKIGWLEKNVHKMEKMKDDGRFL
jgi:tRNA-Thr(GGU) m(6)t(6)A37 methyltransferase TsaA